MEEQKSNPVGRPTDYNPEYCQSILALGMQGKSVVQMACYFNVVKQTLHDWCHKYPEFLDAFMRAKQLSQDWWETTAQKNMVESPGGARLNAGIWSRSMAARFPDDYREKTDVNLGGQPGNPVNGRVELYLPDNGRRPPAA